MCNVGTICDMNMQTRPEYDDAMLCMCVCVYTGHAGGLCGLHQGAQDCASGGPGSPLWLGGSGMLPGHVQTRMKHPHVESSRQLLSGVGGTHWVKTPSRHTALQTQQ